VAVSPPVVADAADLPARVTMQEFPKAPPLPASEPAVCSVPAIQPRQAVVEWPRSAAPVQAVSPVNEVALLAREAENAAALPSDVAPFVADAARAHDSAVNPLWQLVVTGTRTWVNDMRRTGAAVARLPAPPAVWWLGGSIVLLTWRLVATCVLWRRIRRGRPADPSVRHLVQAIAERMHLRSVPETRMVNARISPLVWITRRKLLVLPSTLWESLDEQGRAAVVAHELAHLRRLDHWVCWLGMLTSCLYWWHPVAWWVCSRVHHESERCCDAWVTWLLPRSRRAYAEAILVARSFLGPNTVIAAPAAGMLTRPARQLARRITMIMTRNDKPRMSWKGGALVAAMALAGWIVSPVFADPIGEPVETPRESLTVEMTAPDADPLMVAEAGDDMDAPRVRIRERRPRAGRNDDVDARLQRLEELVERLAQRLDQSGTPVPAPGPALGFQPAVPTTPPTPPSPPAAWQVRPRVPGGDSREIDREYALPEGRLEALGELMKLQEVPVRVRIGDGKIGVHANPAQQQAFELFADLLKDEETRTYQLPEPQRTKFIELMSRDDVTVVINATDDGVQVRGTPAVQSIVENFIKLLTGQAVSSAGGSPWSTGDPFSFNYTDPKAIEEIARLYGKGARAAGKLHEGKRKAYEGARKAFDTSRETLDKKRKALQEEGEKLRKKASELDKKGVSLNSVEESLRKLFDSADEEAQRKLEEQLASIEATQDGVTAAAEQLEAEAEQLEAQAEALESYLEALVEPADETPPAESSPE
jgi:beta-lactamase regulating signal transducer with metallopeptidase domain